MGEDCEQCDDHAHGSKEQAAFKSWPVSSVRAGNCSVRSHAPGTLSDM